MDAAHGGLSPVLESSREELYRSGGGVQDSNNKFTHIIGTDLSGISPPSNPRVTFCQFISGIARSRIIRSALFAGAAVALTNAFALATVTTAMGAGGTALAALVGTVAAGVLVTLAANPLTYVALLAIGVTALAITILTKKRSTRALSALVTVVAATAFVMLATTPPAWVVLTAVGIAAFGFAIVCQLPKRGAQKLSLECSSMKRLFLSIIRRSESEIKILGRESETAKLYLGAMPSRFTRDLRYLNKKKNVTAVLAFNQPLEKIGRFITHHPYNNATAASEGIMARLDVTAMDHKPLSIDQLSAAAEFINHELNVNQQSVYVHCLAGVGRSAMGVAAYLISQGMSVNEAIATIKNSRPSSTIDKASKRGNLDAYEKICRLKDIKLGDFIPARKSTTDPSGMDDDEARELMQAVTSMEQSNIFDPGEAADAILAEYLRQNPHTKMNVGWETKRILLVRYKNYLNTHSRGA